MGVAVLPKDTRFTQTAGVSLLAGIGFTMPIFVALATRLKLPAVIGELFAGVCYEVVLWTEFRYM